jgi:hypothetical protein
MHLSRSFALRRRFGIRIFIKCFIDRPVRGTGNHRDSQIAIESFKTFGKLHPRPRGEGVGYLQPFLSFSNSPAFSDSNSYGSIKTPRNFAMAMGSKRGTDTTCSNAISFPTFPKGNSTLRSSRETSNLPDVSERILSNSGRS